MFKDKKDLLLFGKEIYKKGFRYRLYFACASCVKEKPARIYRLDCFNKKLFNSCSLGKSYEVLYKNNTMKSITESGDIELTEDDYKKLLRERERQFNYDKYRPFETGKNPDRNYYTLEQVKNILCSKPDGFCCAAYSVIRFIADIICFIVPSAAYGFFLAHTCLAYKPMNRNTGFLTLPTFYFLSVPFLIFVMTLLFAFSEQAIFKYGVFRNIILQNHIYQYGGVQKEFLDKKQKARLLHYGLLTGALFVLGLLIVYL